MTHRTIVIEACVFGGRYGVVVEPRTVDRPMREFKTYAQAKGCAVDLHAVFGWPIEDRMEGDA